MEILFFNRRGAENTEGREGKGRKGGVYNSNRIAIIF